MTINNNLINKDKKVHLVDELQTLLKKQVDLARRGNIKNVEMLNERAASLVEKIIQTGTPRSPQTILNPEQAKLLAKLYEDLYLAISAQKAGLCAELKQIRKGKRTIQAYRSHI